MKHLRHLIAGLVAHLRAPLAYAKRAEVAEITAPTLLAGECTRSLTPARSVGPVARPARRLYPLKCDGSSPANVAARLTIAARRSG